jgi:hypothetical protein
VNSVKKDDGTVKKTARPVYRVKFKNRGKAAKYWVGESEAMRMCKLHDEVAGPRGGSESEFSEDND